MLVEANGIPIGVAVEGANRNDFKMARHTIESIPVGAARNRRAMRRRACVWTRGTTTTRSGSC